MWSDNEDILAYLAQTQDAIGSCKERSLTEVLNMVHKDLSIVCVSFTPVYGSFRAKTFKKNRHLYKIPFVTRFGIVSRMSHELNI